MISFGTFNSNFSEYIHVPSSTTTSCESSFVNNVLANVVVWFVLLHGEGQRKENKEVTCLIRPPFLSPKGGLLIQVWLYITWRILTNHTTTFAKTLFTNAQTNCSKNKCKIWQTLMNILTRFSEQLLTFEFARVNTEVFSTVGLVLEYVALANNHLQIATCIYSKSSNYKFQRRSYIIHKHRNLVKPMVIVASDGYILTGVELFFHT
jgi:hypothetical protein